MTASNERALTDAALDDLLRASAPQPLPDDGFVARTMAEVERAARSLPAHRRPAPVAPMAIARALAAEQRRHDAQARLWRWAIAGVFAGILLLAVAVAAAPGGLTLTRADLSNWYAWQEFRAT